MSKPLIPTKDLAKFMNQALPQAVGQDMLVPDDNGVQPGEEGYIPKTITKEITELDTTNISDFGRAYDELPSESKMNFKKDLVTLVTKQVFVMKKYTPWGPDITRTYDGPRGILQKIKMPIQYNALDSTSMFEDPQVTTSNFVDFEVTARYFNMPTTKKMRFTISDKIMNGLFKDMNSASKFISMIWNSVSTSMAIHLDTLSMGVINTATATIMQKGKDTQKYNLLEMYNTYAGTTLTVEEALRTKEFHRYAKSEITRIRDLMIAPSGIFNMYGIPTQTTSQDCYTWFLSNFTRTADEYLLSDTFNKELVKLSDYSSVSRWQGIGDSGSFEDVSTIAIETVLPGEATKTKMKFSGIIGVIAHHDSVAITDIVETTESKYEPEDRYTAFYPNMESNSIIDLEEDYVVFYMAETPAMRELRALAVSNLEQVEKEPVKEVKKTTKKKTTKKKTTKEEPVKEEPVKEEPVKEEPVKEEPVKEEPVKEEPVKEEIEYLE